MDFKKPTTIKGIVLLFLGILFLYGLVFLLVIPLIAFDEWNLGSLITTDIENIDNDGKKISTSIPGELFVSFAASALQDILFFLVTGIAIFIFSSRKPEDDSLAQKLMYLFPKAKGDSVLTSYLETSVNKLGCIADKAHFIFTILEYNEKLSAFKVQIHFESHLRNLHNKDHYSDPRLAMNLMSDLDTEPPHELYGQLEHVRVYNFDGASISNLDSNESDYPINMKEKHFKHSCTFSLAPHAVALFDAKHWEWSPVAKRHSLRVSRFTKQVDFKCVNNSGRVLSIEVGQISSDNDSHKQSLDNHESYPLPLGEVAPGDGITISLSLDKDHHKQ